jgi:hypothetical protein
MTVVHCEWHLLCVRLAGPLPRSEPPRRLVADGGGESAWPGHGSSVLLLAAGARLWIPPSLTKPRRPPGTRTRAGQVRTSPRRPLETRMRPRAVACCLRPLESFAADRPSVPVASSAACAAKAAPRPMAAIRGRRRPVVARRSCAPATRPPTATPASCAVWGSGRAHPLRSAAAVAVPWVEPR